MSLESFVDEKKNQNMYKCTYIRRSLLIRKLRQTLDEDSKY